MNRLKKRDEDVIAFVKDYMLKNGITPTLREIGEGVGMSSTATVQAHFDKLVRLGYIKKYGLRYTVKGIKYAESE